MNEPRLHLNEMDVEDRMTKKGLKKIECYYLYEQGYLPWLNHRNSTENKICSKNSYWFMRIVFNLKKCGSVEYLM